MGATTPVPVVDAGLGNSTYLLDLGEGRALVLDPQRDLRNLRAEAAARGLRITHAVETHLHTDFVSGVAELAAVEGARVVSPVVGERAFDYLGLADGAELDLGRLTLRAMQTPGHSPEHLSYLLYEGENLAGVFTGGSLMVGTAGRSDLIGPEQTVPLARAQYRSLQRLMELPDGTPVWPTHGAGSFCSAGGGTERTTTIGHEHRTNPLVQLDGEEAFTQALTARMGTFPGYFHRLPEVNRRGPAVLAPPAVLEALTPARVRELLADGAQVVDARPTREFAAGHIPGAISIPFRAVFALWLGWLVDPRTPLVIVRGTDQDPEDIAAEAAKVGFDSPVVELAGGMGAWIADGGTTARSGITDAAGLASRSDVTVIDVRQAAEYAVGHVPGAINIELGSLLDPDGPLPEGPLVAMCGHSERAGGGASLLQRAGLSEITIVDGGPDDWAAAAGRPVAKGPGCEPGNARSTTRGSGEGAASGPVLGLRQNLAQFLLLVAVNALVGGTLGQERTVLPLLASDTFQLDLYTSALTYILAFGLSKAAMNYFAGTLSDRFGRKPVLVAGWLVALPVPLMLIFGPSWGWIIAANVLLGISQGLTWSTTVIMKMDLVGPKQRGLAMGLNEAAGYLGVAVTALATGYLASAYGLRPGPGRL